MRCKTILISTMNYFLIDFVRNGNYRKEIWKGKEILIDLKQG